MSCKAIDGEGMSRMFASAQQCANECVGGRFLLQLSVISSRDLPATASRLGRNIAKASTKRAPPVAPATPLQQADPAAEADEDSISDGCHI